MADVVEIILKLQQVRQFVSGADKAGDAVEGIGKSAEKSGKKAQSGYASLAKWAGGAALVYGATKVMRSSVTAASDLNEEVNKTKVVFGASGAGIVKWSEDSATAIGASQQEALAAAGTFGNMLVPMGFARKEAGGMSKGLVQLGGDLASFNNASPEETLDALRAGLAGEAEPLRRFGVFLSAARVQAKALAMGLVKGAVDTVKFKKAQLDVALAQRNAGKAIKKYGADSLEARKATLAVSTAEAKLAESMKGKVPELTAAQKAQASYALIMQDTKDAQGDVQRSSHTLAAQQRRLHATWVNMQANLGTQLLPIVVDVLGAFMDFLKIIAPLTKNTTLFKIALFGVVTAFVAYKAAMIAATIATTVFNASAAPAAIAVGAIVVAIAALGIGLYLLYKRSATFRKAVDATWRFVKKAFAAMLDAFRDVFAWVKQNWPLLLGILTGPIGLAVVMILKHRDQIMDALGEAKDAIVGAFTTAKDWIAANWPLLLPILLGPFGLAAAGIIKYWGAITKGAQTAATAIANAFRAATGAVKGAINVVIRGWNRLQFKMPSVDTHIPGVGKVGGFTVGVPQIPELAHGGTLLSSGAVIVGERGPELLSLPVAARVEPLPPAGILAGASGGDIEVTIPVVLDGRELTRVVARITADQLARR